MRDDREMTDKVISRWVRGGVGRLAVGLAVLALGGCVPAFKPLGERKAWEETAAPASRGETTAAERAGSKGMEDAPEGPSPASTATGGEAPVELVEQVPQPVVALPVERCAARLVALGKEQDHWRRVSERLARLGAEGVAAPAGWQECARQAGAVHEGYQRLLERTRDGLISLPGEVDPWVVVMDDLDYLGGRCSEIYRQGETLAEAHASLAATRSVAEGEKLIARAADLGLFEDVIAVYRELKAAHLEGEIGFQTRKTYGEALLRTGHLEGAEEAFRKLLAEGEPPEATGREWIALRMRYADLLLALGRLEQAKAQYHDLEEFFIPMERAGAWVEGQLRLLEGDAQSGAAFLVYRKLLQNWLAAAESEVPPQMRSSLKVLEEEYGSSALLSSAREVLRLAEERRSRWIERRFVSVEDALRRKDFPAAGMFLEELGRMQFQFDEDRQERLVSLRDQLASGKVLVQEEQARQQEDALSIQWQVANRALEEGKFDEALAAFEVLRGTRYGEEADRKIRQGQDRAAQRLRQQAADLFARAQKIADSEEKLRLLKQSQALLMEIVGRYPQADVIPKVKQNLTALERQIAPLDGAR